MTGPGPNEFRLITTGGPGLLNLGEDRSGVVRLWASVDGRDWQEQGTTDILRSVQDWASGTAVLDSRVIAVGEAWTGAPASPGSRRCGSGWGSDVVGELGDGARLSGAWPSGSQPVVKSRYITPPRTTNAASSSTAAARPFARPKNERASGISAIATSA